MSAYVRYKCDNTQNYNRFQADNGGVKRRYFFNTGGVVYFTQIKRAPFPVPRDAPHRPARGTDVDAPDGFGDGFRVRSAEFADNGHMPDFPESQIPRAGATAEGADAAHVSR